MRRLSALAPAFAAAAGAALGGCGGGATSADLVVWETYGNEEHAVFLEIVRDFEAAWRERTGEAIRVRVELIPFGGHVEKIKFAAITHTTPDIARVDAAQLVDLAYGNAVYDLREIDPAVEEYLADFLPVAAESVRIPVRGEVGVYGLPDQVTGVAVFYNRALFREAGIPEPPRTLDSLARADPPWDAERFLEVAKALTKVEEGIYGVALEPWFWFHLPWFNAFGATFVEFQADGTVRATVDSDSAAAALVAMARNYWEGAEAGAWAPGAVPPEQGFLNGRYAMILTGPWNLKKFREAGIDFGVALFPEGPNRRRIETPEGTFTVGTSTNVGGTDMVIMRSCKRPELAYAFLKFLTSPEVQARWCNDLEQIPVNRKAEPLVRFEAGGPLATFMDQMRTAIPRPKIPRYGVFEGQIMTPQIRRILAAKEDGPAEVERALDEAKEELARRILNDVNAGR